MNTERIQRSERPMPYVGISGVNNGYPIQEDVQYWLLDQYAYSGLANDDGNRVRERELALGVKATHKTQYLDSENKYGRDSYPVGEDEFANALDGPMGIFSAQIFMDPERVGDSHYRNEFVARICRRGAKWLNTLQFDLLPWHKDDSMLPFIEKVKVETGHTIILQAHAESMEQLGPEGVEQKLGRYANALDYILFDASHGKGVRMDPAKLLLYLDAAYESPELSRVSMGVAGGLNAEVVKNDMPMLLEKYNDLSVDAEGQLHDYSPDGVRGLNWWKAKAYMEALSDVLYALSKRDV